MQGSAAARPSARLLSALAFCVAALAAQAEPTPRVIEPGSSGSAFATAQTLLRHLAAGEIEAAARMSNAPQRRQEVLRDYRASVGEEEFKRVFAQYFLPENRVVAEVALGPRRLLVWDFGAADHVAGQYFVEVNGAFLIDDVPSEERSQLRRVLESYRKRR